MSAYLEVDGIPALCLHRYVIRWTLEGEDFVPALYRDGKRVTTAWTLLMTEEVEADEHGGNANTA